MQVDEQPGTQTASTVFDTDASLRLNRARQEVLRDIITDISTVLPLRTGLDVGCGVGHFTQLLGAIDGLRVHALDARQENIAEIRRRLSHVSSYVANIESPEVRRLGAFDLVLCFGLLYHLENPLAAIRNLAALTSGVLLIESQVIPGRRPSLMLLDEDLGRDQSLCSVALYPSESCLIRMCYVAGFTRVYRVRELPDHEDFRSGLFARRRRTMLAAARVDLNLTSLACVCERHVARDLWVRRWVPSVRLARSLRPHPNRVVEEKTT